MAVKRTPTHLSKAVGMPPAMRRALRRRFMAAVAATPADPERRPPFSVDRERFHMFADSVGLGGIAEEVNMFDMFDGNDDGYVSYVSVGAPASVLEVQAVGAVATTQQAHASSAPVDAGTTTLMQQQRCCGGGRQDRTHSSGCVSWCHTVGRVLCCWHRCASCAAKVVTRALMCA